MHVDPPKRKSKVFPYFVGADASIIFGKTKMQGRPTVAGPIREGGFFWQGSAFPSETSFWFPSGGEKR